MLIKKSHSIWYVLIILTIFIVLVLSAGSQKSETIDEGLFIAGGAAQVQYINPNIDLSHPPLLRWLSGLSTTFLGNARAVQPLPFLTDHPFELFFYNVQDVFEFGIRFFYDMGNDHDQVLFWGRFPFVFLGALLGFLIFLQARRFFGIGPAFVAMLAFLFTPEVLAHSQWAHSDLASALTLFIISIALYEALLNPSWKIDLLLGGALGLAVSVKLTALIQVPLVLVLLAIFGRIGLFAFIKRTVLIISILYIIIVVVYLPEPRIMGPHIFFKSDLDRLGIAWLEPLLRFLPLPDTFLRGIFYTLLLSQHGQIAFLHGQISTSGWWYYFPVAIFLKYPNGLLLVALAGLLAQWRGSTPLAQKVAFSFPPLTVLGTAMLQSINIGVRSMIPLAPYFAFWSGAALWYWHNRITRIIISLLITTSIISGIFAYPDFLTYFNPLLGGTSKAHKWLGDSNIDWGQDLPALARELKKRNIREIKLAYFGAGRPSYYGIIGLYPQVIEPGWYAISRSYLAGQLPLGNLYSWLSSMQPVTLVGGSIALFCVDENMLPCNLEQDKLNRKR